MQFRDGRRHVPWLLESAGTGHGVKGIGHRNDLRLQRNLTVLQPLWLSVPIGLFVMGKYPVGDSTEVLHGP